MRFPSLKMARVVQVAAVAAVSFVFCAAAGAQAPTSGNVFFGYSYINTGPFFNASKRSSLNGWEGSLEGKVLPWVGFVADFSGHYGSQSFGTCPEICSPANFHEQNFLFGPRLSVSIGKARPFAEALFGAGHVGSDVGSDTSFATAVGGGLDYKIIRPVAWRFQGDYLQTRLFGTTQNNVRLSTGIVFRF